MLVIAAYIFLLVVSGLLLNRKEQTTRGFFLGSRQMPVWAVAISVLATSQSAATFLGGPDQGYRGDLSYLTTNLAAFIAAGMVAAVLLPRFYQHQVYTVYELLARRFSAASKYQAALLYLGGRVFASGARLYMAALAVAMLLFGNISPSSVLIAISIITLTGLLYTLAGGIRTVIYTDVVQAVLYIGAAVAVVITLLYQIDADMSTIITALQTPSDGGPDKLTWLNTDPGLGAENAFSLWSILTGFVLLNIAAFGLDQDMTQRLLTCQNKRQATRAMLLSVVMGIPVVGLFICAGMLLFIVYQRPDLTGLPLSELVRSFEGQTETVFMHYVLNALPAGVKGLVVTGIIAAALSTLNSGLNAMASVLVQDILPGRHDNNTAPGQAVRAGRWAMTGIAVVLALMAALCFYWQQYTSTPLLQFALGVMVFSYSGLLGVYFVAFFTHRGSQRSVTAALLCGFAAPLLCQPYIQQWWLPDTAQFDLAFTWQLLCGATVSFVVCLCGTPSYSKEHYESPRSPA